MAFLAIVGIGIMAAIVGGPTKSWHTVLYITTVILAALLGYAVVFRQNRLRMASLEQALRAKHFHLILCPTMEERQRLWSRMGPISGSLDIIGGAAKIRWIAHSADGGEDVWIFETQHTTRNGKNTRIHNRIIIAWPAGSPELPGTDLGHEPEFVMSLLSWLDRRAVRKQELDHLAFHDLKNRWSIHGSVETGRRFLTPAVRMELAHSPKGESWCMGGGWVFCIFRGILNGAEFSRFYERSQQLLKKCAAPSPRP